MKLILIILVLAGLATGCTTQANARAQAQKAYLAGQNEAMRRMQAQSGITVIGPVQNASVPWVAGLSLAQAIATANYLSAQSPAQIILTRQGEDAVIDPNDLERVAQFMLEPGDVITLKP